MNRSILAILSVLAFLTFQAMAQGPNDLNSGSQLALSSSTGAYTFSWWGVGGYTYLIETSDDLVNWSYLPIVESGSDSVIAWGFTSNSTSLFMQLEYITVPAIDLSGPALNGPQDPSGNGLPGDWELFFFGSLGVDPNIDPNGEGFTVLQDYENGNNPIADQVVTAGPCVGEYLFHETSGTVAHDISSLHNNGLLSGGASWTGTGGYDGEGSIKFDGTSGEVLVSDSANQVVPASGAPFSFALWFEPNITGSGKAALVSAGISGSTGFQFGVDSTVSPPNLFFSISGSGGTEVETPIAPGGWTQAAVSYDGTNASLYVNGIEQVSGTGLMLSDTSTITLAQGYAGTQPFAGAMENLTFYQADLQQADVTSLCNLSTTSTGPDSSGLPNYWKYQYFGTLSVDPTATVAWSNGQITNLQAYQLGLNPIDFYNAQTPILAIVSGSGQIGSPGGFAPAPLVVSVSDTSGNPLTSAPVTFTVVSGSGQVKQSYMSSPANSLTVFANGAGQAEVYFQLSSGSSTTSEITATAGPASSPAEVIFTESTDNGCGTYGSPFAPSNVAAVLNPDGSADISWQNNTDDPSDIPVKIKQRDGSWATVTTVPAGTTYVHIPAQ